MEQIKDEGIVIGVRLDGNQQIGMGHLMRCLSIAQALQSLVASVVFFTATQECVEVIDKAGFTYQILEAGKRCMEDEIPCLCEEIENKGIDLLLVDSYLVTVDYLKKLNEFCPIFYIDDMGRDVFPVSGIINYNIYGKNLGYEKKYGRDVILLLGPHYAPIRKEFGGSNYKVRPEVKKILLTMGGSDRLNIAGDLSQKLLERLGKEVRVEVICGRFNPHYQELMEFSKRAARLTVLVDVQDMWNRIAEADIVIVAAGSTMYEISAMGIPSICFYYVENQRQIAEGFALSTGMENGGDYTGKRGETIQKVLEEVDCLIEDYDRRVQLSKNLKRVTDGRGAYYLAEQLKKYVFKRRECG